MSVRNEGSNILAHCPDVLPGFKGQICHKVLVCLKVCQDMLIYLICSPHDTSALSLFLGLNQRKLVTTPCLYCHYLINLNM